MSTAQDSAELQQIRNQVSFGLDCQAFMQSTIGKYLAGRANADMESALEDMKTVNAEDPKAIRELQNRVKVAECFLIWMGEAVTEGENAERTYIDSQD